MGGAVFDAQRGIEHLRSLIDSAKPGHALGITDAMVLHKIGPHTQKPLTNQTNVVLDDRYLNGD